MRIFLLLIALSLLLTNAHAGEPVKATNLEKLNTAADEEDPCPTPDGFGMLYVKKGKKYYELQQSKRAAATAPFGPGTPFFPDRDHDVRSPFFSQGKYYFAANEIPDEKLAAFRNYDVMLQIGKQRATSIITNDLNSKVDEMYPWIAAAGKEFYFSRKTDDGWKLMVVNGAVPGPVKAKEVGFPADYHRATLFGASFTMYLQGPLEDGKIGIFRSKRAKAGDAWSKPEPVTGLNHPDSKKGDMQPALSADGTRLYFVSDRPGGKGGLDIWSVPTAMLK